MSTGQSSKKVSFFARGDFPSLVLWLGAVLVTLGVTLTSLIFIWPLSLLLDRRLTVMHRAARFWAWFLVTFNPAWRIQVSGVEALDTHKNYVIVANHQSIVDIVAVLYALPLQFKFVSKKEVFQIPAMGWHMRAAGYLSLERGSGESGKKILLESRSWLQKGISMLFFPEGTRSLDGQIHAFKLGAFKLAKDVGVEILPVVVDGTGDCVPKNTWKVSKPAVFKVSIGKPVDLGRVASDDLPSAVEKIRCEMSARLAALRAGKP